MRMMPTPRMRRHFLLSTMLIVVLLVMNTGRNVNGDQAEAPAKEQPQQQEQPPPLPGNKPEVQTGPCGLGKHTLNTDGKVTLEKGSRKAEDAELKNYNKGSGGGKFKGCKVENKDGFFIVHYDENAANEGCAVDFIAKQEMASKIEFKASVTDDGSCLAKCASLDAQKLATNENIVPFVFSQNNARVLQLHNEPEYKGKPKPDGTTCSVDCTALSAKGECISFTALEIRWAKCIGSIRGYLHQVGEPNLLGTPAVVGVGTGTNEATMDISGTANKEEDGASFTYKGTPLPSPPVCISAIDKGIPVPKAWPIVNGVGDLKDSYLFVFHLLPQTATRKYDGPKISNQKPQGMLPACMEKGLSFKFSTSLYTGLLTTLELPTTPSTTTTTTAKPSPPSGSDQTEKTVETTGATSPSGEPTTTTSASPEVQPPANGSSSPTNLPIMEDVRLIATAAVSLVIIIVLIIVIICLYRKYKKAKASPAGIIESGTRKDGNMDGPEKMIKPTMVQTEAEYGSEDFDDPSNMDNRRKDDGLEETKMDGHQQQQQPKDNDDADDNRKKDGEDEGYNMIETVA